MSVRRDLYKKMNKQILFIIGILFIIFLSSFVSADPVISDVTNYSVMQLDMNTNCTYDTSPVGAVPTIVSDPAFDGANQITNNLLGTCHFDGNDALCFNMITPYNESDRDYTFMAWFAWEGSSSTNHHIFATSETSDTYVFAAGVRNGDADKAWFAVRINGQSETKLLSSAAYTTGVHYVVFSQNVSHLNMWVDGVKQTPTATTHNGFSLTTKFCIGARAQATPDRFWQGNLTQVLFLNVSVGQAIVDFMYDSGNGTSLEEDITLPVISDVICTSPEPDDSAEPYTTFDTTPTFNFTTDETTECFLSDDNSTWFGCSTTNTTGEHICTLDSSQALSLGTDYVNVNCTDTSSNSAYDEWEMDIYEEPHVIITATSLNTSNFDINNCTLANLTSTKWNLSCTGANLSVSRAKIYKTLFYGTDGTNPKVLNITGLTKLETSISSDVGKQAFYAKVTHSFEGAGGQVQVWNATFSNTIDNYNTSSWSYLTASGTAPTFADAYWYINLTTLRSQATKGTTIDETGTDTSADDIDNASDSKLSVSVGGDSIDSGSATGKVIILTKGGMTWTFSGSGTPIPYTDFKENHSVPLLSVLGEPEVTLLYPSNGSINYSSTTTFIYNVTENIALDNCSLYLNSSGTFGINLTNTSPTNNAENNFAISLSEGGWLWNVECCDNSGNCAFGADNWTLTKDIIVNITEIWLTSPDPDQKIAYPLVTGNTTNSTPVLNLTTDNNGNCYLGSDNSTWTVCSTTGGTGHICIQPTSLGYSPPLKSQYFKCNTTSSTDYEEVNLNITDETPPVCEVMNYTIDIEQNSTGTYEITINCSDDGGLNVTKTGDHYAAFITRTLKGTASPGAPNLWSVYPPPNNLTDSSGVISESILRAKGRNEGYWYEILNIFNDTYTYAVNDGEYDDLIITNYTGYAIFNFSGLVEPNVFRQHNYLSVESMTAEPKKNYSIYKNNPLLVRVWVLETMRSTQNWTPCLFKNINYSNSPNRDLIIFYCNETYDKTSGVIVEDSENCVAIGAEDTTTINEIEFFKENSSYSKGCFAITDGKIGGIQVTNESYLYFKSETQLVTGNYLFRYANGSTNTNTSFKESQVAWESSDGGVNWNQANFTQDMFYTTVKEGDQFQLGVWVQDIYGNNYSNFSLHTDDIGDVNFPISKPSILEYHQGVEDNVTHIGDADLNGTYYDNMTIHILISLDPDEVGAVEHNLTLRYTNGSYHSTINGSFFSADDSDVHIFFDTTNVSDGTYKMNITANLSGDVKSFLTFNNFTINNKLPTNVTLCPNMSALRFRPNVTKDYNWSTGKILVYNLSAVNASACNYSHHLKNIAAYTSNISVYITPNNRDYLTHKKAYFDLGDYNQTFYNYTNKSVQINTSLNYTNGSYLSEVFDGMSQTAQWGNMSWNTLIPSGAVINISVKNCTYSNCSDGDYTYLGYNSPQNFSLDGRYFRYNVSFILNQSTNISPELYNTTINYTNTEADDYRLWCNNVSVNSSTQRLYTNLNSESSYFFNCTMSFLNATTGWKFTLNFTEG